MLRFSCLCGQLRVELTKRPDFIHACNCTLCRKTGAHWGYFDPDDVTVCGTSQRYSRRDKDVPSAEIHFCGDCGSTTHFNLTEDAVARHGNTMMGANLLLAEESDLAGVELRFPDGLNWAGEGGFAYVREPRIIGASETHAQA